MLTKLYGGQGPVYLNVSLSKRLAIALTLASNALSRSREMRKAAFMIILSPMGLLIRDVSVASRINKPIGDKMIMNAAFLISRDRESAFDARVKAIASRFDKLTFKYTGPWPPYNFVNILSLIHISEP